MEISLGARRSTCFAACDPLISLAVATTGLENTLRAEAGFSPSLNIRVFQHRVMGRSSSAKAATIGQNVEEETRYGLFCWPRYLDGRDPRLRRRSRRRGRSPEQDGVDGSGDCGRARESAELSSHRIRDGANGAYLGLVPRRYQSGEIDYVGSISKCGDRRVRTLLYEAANVMLTRYKGQLKLKDWAFAIAKRSTMRKARVALARRLAIIMHAMLRDGTEFASA